MIVRSRVQEQPAIAYPLAHNRPSRKDAKWLNPALYADEIVGDINDRRSAERNSEGYNPRVAEVSEVRASEQDETLLDWFLSLDAGQRLAELESRLTFINSVRRDGDSELSPDT